MTHILRLAFVMGVSILLTPAANADMGPECGPKSRVHKPKARPHCPPRHHVSCHKPDLCSLNCCEVRVNQQEIARSENLQYSGTLHADSLYNEYVRTEALNLAIQKRECAVELCKKCPEEAKALIAEARHLEFNWRHIEGCDWAPIDPCGEDVSLIHHRNHHRHHASQTHCG